MGILNTLFAFLAVGALAGLVLAFKKPGIAFFLKNPNKTKAILSYLAIMILCLGCFSATMSDEQKAEQAIKEQQRAEEKVAKEAQKEAQKRAEAELDAKGLSLGNDEWATKKAKKISKKVDKVILAKNDIVVVCYYDDPMDIMYWWTQDVLGKVPYGLMQLPGIENFKALSMELTTDAEDKYGNRSVAGVVNVGWKMATLNKVNWEGGKFDGRKLLSLADSVKLGPLKSEVIKYCVKDAPGTSGAGFCKLISR